MELIKREPVLGVACANNLFFCELILLSLDASAIFSLIFNVKLLKFYTECLFSRQFLLKENTSIFR